VEIEIPLEAIKSVPGLALVSLLEVKISEYLPGIPDVHPGNSNKYQPRVNTAMQRLGKLLVQEAEKV